MSYDYEGFRFTSNVNVGAGESSYAGFASRVDGEVGSAFITIATAAGAMMGLYTRIPYAFAYFCTCFAMSSMNLCCFFVIAILHTS